MRLSLPNFLQPEALRLKYADGFWPNLLAVSYSVAGFFLGLYLTSVNGWILNLLGTLWLAHAMIIASYLVHECAHNTIFADNAANARLGAALNWLNGACYGDYEGIRNKHFRHHVDRADVVAVDYREFLQQHPKLAKICVLLEWCYIPAVEIFMHIQVLRLPFAVASRRAQRRRVILALAVRLPLFALLAWYSPKAFLLYLVAYWIMLTVLRFMDAFQHTYEVSVALEETKPQPGERTPPKFDRAYEERNTFSNPIAVHSRWLDLLTLNFGFHNAHHTKPAQPWYRLPQLHRDLYGDDQTQVLPFGNQLRAFHRFRVQRVTNADVGDIGVQADRGASFVGVDGVSFLTAL